MPFLLLLLLMLVCYPRVWPAPSFLQGSLIELTERSIGLTAVAMALMVGSAALLADWTSRQLHRGLEHRETALRRYGLLRMAHLFTLILVYGLAVWLLGWGWTVQHVFTTADATDPPRVQLALMYPGAELILLAPFLAALVLSWACFYEVERALHQTSSSFNTSRPFWGRWAYVLFHLRQNLALILPPLVLLVVSQGLSRCYPNLHDDLSFQIVSYGLLVLVLVSMPWGFRLVLGLKPLPAGPQRDQLLRAAERLNFRCTNLLVWPTRGGVANAMVVGVLPMLRYVVFTDRLLSEMTPEELEAVFGHEVGHVKHRHILYYLGFLVISVGVVAGIWLAVFGDSDWVMPPMVLSLGAYVFLVFGFLSRRCERQADIYGCRAVSCTHRECPGHSADMVPAPRGIGLCSTGINTFIGALEKVARLNGISRSKPGWLNSWLHSTIACRVEFLQQMLVDPGLEARFQRRVGLVKWGLILALGSILLGLAAWHWFEGKPPSDAAVALSQVCPVDTGIESEG